MKKRVVTLSLVGLVGLGLGAGCDDGTSIEASLTASDAPEEKYTPELALALAQGTPQDVLVMLDDGALQARRAALRFVPHGQDYSALAGQLAQDLTSVKNAVIAAVSAEPLVTLREYSNLPVMNLHLSSEQALKELADNPLVAAIAADRMVYAMDTPPTNLSSIRQPNVAAMGYMGEGASVAVLDTGTDYTRAPFGCTAAGQPAECPVVVAKDFAVEDKALDQGSFHGTNVAGIVLSVAPKARILALDVFDGDGAWTSTILSAINWCVQHKADHNIVAMNLSLGGGLFASACPKDPFEYGLAPARAAGILPIVASGNNGSKTSLSSPACAPSAISVGAVYSANVGSLRTSVCTDTTSAADKVACFSNSASFLTMWAPGVGITGAGITMSGTSQATPHVAGAAALLAAAYPSDTADARAKRLTTSGTTITDARNKVKKPRLDLEYALGVGSGSVAPSGKVTINQGAAYSKVREVSVNVSTTTGTAAEVCLSNVATCTTWQAYSPTLIWVFPVGDGKKTLYVRWKNAYGKASSTAVSASIIVDSLAPIPGRWSTKVSGQTVKWTFTGWRDATSGIARYTLVANTSPPASCSDGTVLYSGAATSWTSGILPVGTLSFRLCAVDKAGNTSNGILGTVIVK